MRKDYLEAGTSQSPESFKQGLILEHPLDNTWEDDTSYPRVAPEVLKSMLEKPTGFVAGYHDPFSTKAGKTHWGAYAPVPNTAERSATAEKERGGYGWFVLVQKPATE